MSRNLLLVPGDEHGVDRHKADLASKRAAIEQAGFPEPDHGNVDGAPAFCQAWLLEVADDEGVETLLGGTECVADRLIGTAELGERMEEAVGWADAVDLDDRPGRTET